MVTCIDHGVVVIVGHVIMSGIAGVHQATLIRMVTLMGLYGIVG